MIYARYIEDGTLCSTSDYSNDPEKYRGLIACFECGQKTWFIKGFTTEKFERKACFAAHHEKGCNASTVLLTPVDDSSEEGSESETPSSDIRVDLDKSSGQSIYVSQENRCNQSPSLCLSVFWKRAICCRFDHKNGQRYNSETNTIRPLLSAIAEFQVAG